MNNLKKQNTWVCWNLEEVNGKKKKAMQNRIEAVKARANDKLYYCEELEK